MTDHKQSLGLATAALLEIISRSQAMQAATIRGASQEEIEVMRSESHSVLDAYLDHSVAAATHVRAILEP